MSEAINLPDDYKVSAVFDDNGNKLVAWTIVKVEEDGTLKPITGTYTTIKELIAETHFNTIIKKQETYDFDEYIMISEN